MEPRNYTGKELYSLYLQYKKKGMAKRAHGIVKKHVDPDFSARDLQELYDQKNWNSLIENDLEGHFDLYGQRQRNTIGSKWIKILGDPSNNPAPVKKKPIVEKETSKNFIVEEKKPIVEKVVEKETSANFNEGALSFLNISMGDVFQKLALEQMPKVKQAIEGKLEQMIDEEASKRVPTQIIINEVVKGKVKGSKHVQFEKLLRKITRHRKAYLGGPTGSGKTFLAEQVAQGLGLRFASISMTAGLSEGHLTGRTTINGDYLVAEFVDLYENGGVFLVDEVDAADSNTLLTLNKALSNAVGGTINVPYRTDRPQAKMHKDFYLVCAGNTWGDGDDGDYVGREVMDRAFMNRFSTSKIPVEYDESLEETLLKDCPEVFRRFREIRNNIRKSNIGQVVATRTMVDARVDFLDGDSIDEIVNDFMVGWSEEEKIKALA